MNRSLFVIVSLACAVSLSYANVSFFDELGPIEFNNP